MTERRADDAADATSRDHDDSDRRATSASASATPDPDSLTDDELDAAIAAADAPRGLRGRRGRLVAAAVVAALVLSIGGIVIGRVTSPNPPLTPTSTSAEAGFSRDMQTHHEQAVQMALFIYDETSDARIRTIAYDIAQSQSQQAGQMYGWLEVWGVPQRAPEPSMTWMTRPALDGSTHGHDGMGDEGSDTMHVPGEPMPGLATAAQIQELESSTGLDADRQFLQLMIAHHEGGLEMAEAILERTESPVVTAFANGVIVVQQGEIDYMTQLLAEGA